MYTWCSVKFQSRSSLECVCKKLCVMLRFWVRRYLERLAIHLYIQGWVDFLDEAGLKEPASWVPTRLFQPLKISPDKSCQVSWGVSLVGRCQMVLVQRLKGLTMVCVFSDTRSWLLSDVGSHSGRQPQAGLPYITGFLTRAFKFINQYKGKVSPLRHRQTLLTLLNAMLQCQPIQSGVNQEMK